MRLLTILVLTLVVVAFIDARSSISNKREIKPSEDAVSNNDHSTENTYGLIKDENEPHEHHNELREKRKSRIGGLHLLLR